MWPDVVAAPFYVASALLVLAGVTKLRDPSSLVRVLRQARVVSSRAIVKAFGSLEVAAGTAALIRPGFLTGVAVAALYVTFSGFLLWVLVERVPVTSCGCLGARETPPSVVHLVLNVCAAAAAAAVAAGITPSGVLPFAIDLSYLAVPFLIGAAAIAYAAYLAVAFLPAALSSYQRVAGSAASQRS
jgi:hypothetical protein